MPPIILSLWSNFLVKYHPFRTVMTSVFPHILSRESISNTLPSQGEIRKDSRCFWGYIFSYDRGQPNCLRKVQKKRHKQTQGKSHFYQSLDSECEEGTKNSKTARGRSFQFRNSFKHLSLDILMRNWSTNEIVHCSLRNTLTWWNGREIRFWWNRFARGLNCNKTGERNGIVLQFCTFSVRED